MRRFRPAKHQTLRYQVELRNYKQDHLPVLGHQVGGILGWFPKNRASNEYVIQLRDHNDYAYSISELFQATTQQINSLFLPQYHQTKILLSCAERYRPQNPAFRVFVQEFVLLGRLSRALSFASEITFAIEKGIR